MPPTVIVNMMTAAHSGSTGMSIAFPDVCKTPVPPAGPIPIPYPNIAMTSDAAKEAKKVKFDGAKLMVKGSNIKMSSGDEAGSAQGLVSSKIKGKAEFANYSFDVKAGGKNVCRLLDPMQQNLGSANTFGPAELQPPQFASAKQLEACERSQEKADEQKGKSTSWGKCGIISDHQPKIQEVVTKMKIQLWFRQTNSHCERWIAAGHRPKPHAVIKAKTISGKNQWHAYRWYVAKSKRVMEEGAIPDIHEQDAYLLMEENASRGLLANIYGIVMILDESDENDGMPMRAQRKFWGGWTSISRARKIYRDRWITGDYDLMDVMDVDGMCQRPSQGCASFIQIRDKVNRKLGWDGIQHGPQAQWSPRDNKKMPQTFSVPAKIRTWLKGGEEKPGKIALTKERSAFAVDDNLTVVYPGDAVTLEDHKDVKDAMICMGCHRAGPERRKKR